ncbi:MAG TPA: sorbosone dehydrogenase family protein [Thermoanaerobaculia bacterium]|nr:sorbosone dehydrogenase family protein [Thermoanaerobaculia bacterium]
MRQKPSALALSLLLAACTNSEAQAPPAQQTRAAVHHEIRASSLPKPFATRSAGNPARVVSRPANAQLALPPGFHIAVWAEDLEDPRNMILAPNGDVLVAETAAGRVSVLRDTNHDGRADKRFPMLAEQNEPFGLALRGDQLYVGNGNGVWRFPFKAGQTSITASGTKLFALPAGGHSTRNIIFNGDGSKLYVAAGSRSNVEDETDDPLRAAITEYNADGSGRRTFASGLRNPVGLAWNPANQTLWTAVNERDGLGDDLVPDYITEVKRGAFYGWPFSYIGKNADPRRSGEHPELVAKAIEPSLLIQAHSAPLGVTFYSGSMFPQSYRGGAFVALHGSWNRASRTGYSVVFVPFRNGQPSGGYDDFVTGWAPDPQSRSVWGRPVGLLVLGDGSLLISDDGAGMIWRVTYTR